MYTIQFPTGQGIWTNDRVSLTKCPVFGLCVLTDKGWIPFSNGSKEDCDLVRRLVDHDPLFPWSKELYSSEPSST